MNQLIVVTVGVVVRRHCRRVCVCAVFFVILVRIFLILNWIVSVFSIFDEKLQNTHTHIRTTNIFYAFSGTKQTIRRSEKMNFPLKQVETRNKLHTKRSWDERRSIINLFIFARSVFITDSVWRCKRHEIGTQAVIIWFFAHHLNSSTNRTIRIDIADGLQHTTKLQTYTKCTCRVKWSIWFGKLELEMCVCVCVQCCRYQWNAKRNWKTWKLFLIS